MVATHRHLLHQVNLARSSYSGDEKTSSLAAEYFNSVAATLNSITTLPITSLGTKHTAEAYVVVLGRRASVRPPFARVALTRQCARSRSHPRLIERDVRDACGYTLTALIDDVTGRVAAVRGKSATPCRVGVSGFAAIPGASVTIEKCVASGRRVCCCPNPFASSRPHRTPPPPLPCLLH